MFILWTYKQIRSRLINEYNFLLNTLWSGQSLGTELFVKDNFYKTLTKRKINYASLLLSKVLLMNNRTYRMATISRATFPVIILFNKKCGGWLSWMTLSECSDKSEWFNHSTEELKNRTNNNYWDNSVHGETWKSR